MAKILSVCIPSYNMEKYLSRNLDSFIASGYLDELELIVVNDGSKDKTLEIADGYRVKYPQTIVIIDKPNGHYGSCVNAALKIAKGKYFRILDADDWVDTEALKVLLKALSEVNTDSIYTRYSNYYEKDGSTSLNEDPAKMIWKRSVNLNKIHFDKYVHMHQITYRTDFLKSINYCQTEGICYTDTEYVFKPIVCAKDIFCLDVSLYYYFIGRCDQSMSTNVLMNNFLHLYKVLISIMDYPRPSYTNNNYEFLKEYFIKVLYGMLVDCLYASRFRNNKWNALLHTITKQLEKKGFDFSHYMNYAVHGKHWFKWWYQDTILSRLKLKVLFYMIDIKS